jgi:hypothetical protein
MENFNKDVNDILKWLEDRQLELSEDREFEASTEVSYIIYAIENRLFEKSE